MNYLIFDGYAYGTLDTFIANQIIKKAKHKPGEAWAMAKATCEKRCPACHRKITKGIIGEEIIYKCSVCDFRTLEVMK